MSDGFSEWGLRFVKFLDYHHREDFFSMGKSITQIYFNSFRKEKLSLDDKSNGTDLKKILETGGRF